MGADREEFDITDEKAAEEYITSLRPDAVVHCAAYTAVDKAEDDRDACRKVNVDGTRNIALACEKIGAKLVYISSDYVFGGSGTQPLETDAPKNPQNIYGITKLGGEKEAEEMQKALYHTHLVGVRNKRRKLRKDNAAPCRLAQQSDGR